MLPIWLRLSFVSFCLSVSVPLLGQAGQGTRSVMTNSDVAQMAKAGISESTILLAIQKSSTDFDTSAKSLVELKKQGVSDKLLDAMLVRAEMSTSRPVTGEPPLRWLEGVVVEDVILTERQARNTNYPEEGIAKAVRVTRIEGHPSVSCLKPGDIVATIVNGGVFVPFPESPFLPRLVRLRRQRR